jgi:hypothetical protein
MAMTNFGLIRDLARLFAHFCTNLFGFSVRCCFAATRELSQSQQGFDELDPFRNGRVVRGFAVP